jgi:hypothetical protein
LASLKFVVDVPPGDRINYTTKEQDELFGLPKGVRMIVAGGPIDAGRTGEMQWRILIKRSGGNWY